MEVVKRLGKKTALPLLQQLPIARSYAGGVAPVLSFMAVKETIVWGAERGAESGTGPLNWVVPPTSERSSTGRGILISAHLSRATRGTIGRL